MPVKMSKLIKDQEVTFGRAERGILVLMMSFEYPTRCFFDSISENEGFGVKFVDYVA
jgi:hypothetical protein